MPCYLKVKKKRFKLSMRTTLERKTRNKRANSQKIFGKKNVQMGKNLVVASNGGERREGVASAMEGVATGVCHRAFHKPTGDNLSLFMFLLGSQLPSSQHPHAFHPPELRALLCPWTFCFLSEVLHASAFHSNFFTCRSEQRFRR